MRHLIKGRRLNRTPAHLLALKRNLACNLFVYEQIITTVAKAKELRPFAERLITFAKRGAAYLEEAAAQKSDEAAASHAKAKALHIRRQLIKRLGGNRRIGVKIKTKKKVETAWHNVINKLLNDIGPRFRDRPGGYTRIIKRTQRRVGDAGPTAMIQLLSASETIEAAAPSARGS